MTHRPRIAILHPFQLLLRRGIETYVWGLSTALSAAGVDTTVICCDGPVPVPDSARDTGVRVRRAPSARYFQHLIATPFYMGYLLSGRYDHVFAHFGCYGEGPALCASRALRRTPFSLVFHYPRSLVPHRYREFERWRLQERAEHLITESRFVAEQAESWAGRPVSIIEYGVDSDRFRSDPARRAAVRSLHRMQEAAPLLVTLAALEERKGVQWLIRAMPAVLAVYPDARCLILGEGPYRAEIERVIAELDLAESVTLCGSRPNPEDYLSAADVALLLSYGEASPLVFLEYSASETAIITSQHPPFDEIAAPERSVRVMAENPGLVADAVIGLLSDPERRRAMGREARRWACANHSWPVIARQYQTLIGSRA